MGISYGVNYPAYGAYMPYSYGYPGMYGFNRIKIDAPSEDLYEKAPQETQESKDKEFLTNALLVTLGIVGLGFGGKALLAVPRLLMRGAKKVGTGIGNLVKKGANKAAHTTSDVAAATVGAGRTAVDATVDGSKAVISKIPKLSRRAKLIARQHKAI